MLESKISNIHPDLAEFFRRADNLAGFYDRMMLADRDEKHFTASNYSKRACACAYEIESLLVGIRDKARQVEASAEAVIASNDRMSRAMEVKYSKSEIGDAKADSQ